jgi:ubiquinone/menaquinone biosynthesis C-methylase UbiE
MNRVAAFDVLAETYDTGFVESRIGFAQRQMSRKWLQPLLSGKAELQILEINCGTGADAIWLAEQGHKVTATDASPAMIYQAQQKAAVTSLDHQPSFYTCAFDKLYTTFQDQQFDIIFSNFAGLNCVSPAAMNKLAKQLHTLLRPGGHFAVVLFGKYCLWDTFYYLLKAQPQRAFSRWSNKRVLVPLTSVIYQPVYYYSARKFTRLQSPLRMIEKKPVGFFIPPSWLEAYMQQHPRLFQSLVKWEENINGASFFSQMADHSFILFKKEAS